VDVTTTVETTTTVEITTTTAATTTTTTTMPNNIVEVPTVDPPLAAVGTSSGAETVRLQERLLELGFWLQSADGSYGLTTRQAVMAFQKYLGLPADGAVDADTAAFMSYLTEKPHGRADAGSLLEVDKSRQLLFFVIDGTTEWILNTSTGTEIPYETTNKNDPTKIERGTSVTPAGLHRVNRERPEGWWEGDLGEIYRPKYFIGGVAVHGSNSIPNYPASHGCVRVSVPAMDWIWETGLLPMSAPVWVHGEIPT
jgi:peptidoglycan hydrolase-like protein with peptidoglycan-binding domain